MQLQAPVILPFPANRVSRRPAVLLTSYGTGATRGKNLGMAGYSYDIVAELFAPLLQSWGELIRVPNQKQDVETAARDARLRGLDPIHVALLPFQDACLADSVPNVVVPAWEFPEVPNYAFDGNPQNDWVSTANRCDLILVGGPFTKHAFERAGISAPIRIVQVPTPDQYFDLSPWDSHRQIQLEFPAYCFRGSESRQSSPMPSFTPRSRRPLILQIGRRVESGIRHGCQAMLGDNLYRRMTNPLGRQARFAKSIHGKFPLPEPEPAPLTLSGIVYSSIFNPKDGRKNWIDLLTGFLFALGDCEDATLLVKLITSDPMQVANVLQYFIARDIPHRCRVVFINEYLAESQMYQLAEASTYYLQTTKAEGNCLPLMNYLAAGRPGVSPDHTAMGDYFDANHGFVVESHPEPAAWPQERRLRLRTTWGRIVWPSLVQAIRESYTLAKYHRAEYDDVAARVRADMYAWASLDSIGPRLHGALDLVASGRRVASQAPAANLAAA